MKDVQFLKLIRKSNTKYVDVMKYAIQNIFIYNNDINTIHDAIVNPNGLFKALAIYSSINASSEKKYPQDTIAYSFALIILNIPFLRNNKIGKKWLKKFDEYYTDSILNTPTLKDKTKELYLQTINRIKTDIWNYENDDSTLYTILQNPTAFFEQLYVYCNKTEGRILVDGKKQGLGEHAKDNITSAILSLFIHHEEFRNNHFHIYQEWVEHQKEIRKPIKNKYLTNKPTERQKAAYISYPDVIKKRNELEDGSYERLLLTMYTEIPPIRSDFYDTELCFKESPIDKNKNYITILKNKATLILNNYKTSKKYGQKKINLPIEIIRQIKLSLKRNPRKYLFLSTRFKVPFCDLKDPKGSYNSWANKTLKNLFNQNFSLTMLRHIFITRRDIKIEELSGTERQQIADLMQHSVDQQSRYLWHSWLKENDSD